MDMGHDGETCAQVEREREEYAAELLQLQHEVRRLREELEQADHFGRGEFRVTSWAYEQAVRVMNAREAELSQLRADHELLNEIEQLRGENEELRATIAAIRSPLTYGSP